MSNLINKTLSFPNMAYLFSHYSLTKMGLADSGETKLGNISFVWILSSLTYPQPINKRGIWNNEGIWLSDAIWYK